MTLTSGSALWYWDKYHRVTIDYCMNYAEHYGVPRCVGRVTEAQAGEREQTFRIISRGGQVQEMTSVNQFGYPTAEVSTLDPLGHPSATAASLDTSSLLGSTDIEVVVRKYKYEATKGNITAPLSTVEMENASRKSILKLRYDFTPDRRQSSLTFDVSTGIGLFQRAQPKIGVTALTDEFTGAPLSIEDQFRSKTRISQHRISYDGEGKIERRLFQPRGSATASIADASGVHGYAYEYTPEGLVSVVRNLGPNHQPQPNHRGIALVQYYYDSAGRLVRETNLDRSRKPVDDVEGIATRHLSLDKDGNYRGVRFLDASGSRTLDRISGCSGFRIEQGGQPDTKRGVCLDVDDRTMIGKHGYAIIEAREDGKGRPISLAGYDPNGRPVVIGPIGSHKVTMAYGPDDLRQDMKHFDANDRPVLSAKTGIHHMAMMLDTHGNPIQVSGFGADGTPMPRKGDWAVSIYRRFDTDRGLVLSETGVGIDLQDRADFEYDDLGNMVLLQQFDADGRKINSASNTFSTTTMDWTDRGLMSGLSVKDPHDRPTTMKEHGVHGIRAVHNQYGQVTVTTMVGTDGAPTPSKPDSVARVRFEYNSRGNVLRAMAFDAHDRPTAAKRNGASGIAFRYDSQGNPEHVTFLGPDLNPVNTKAGFSIVRRKYDRHNRMTEEAYFDIAGLRVLNSQVGAWRTTFTHDSRGNVTAVRAYSVDDRPVAAGDLGVWEIRSDYDEYDRLRLETYWGTDGKPTKTRTLGVSRVESDYDERGNIQEVRLYDERGSPVAARGAGYWRLVRKYTPNDQLLSETMYDTRNRPHTLPEQGYTTIQYRHDPRGNVIETSYLDHNGRAVMNAKEGCAFVTAKHNERDNMVEGACYGVDRRPLNNKAFGIHREVMEYDERDRIRKLWFHDVHGRLTNNSNGFAHRTNLYDARDNLIEATRYSASDPGSPPQPLQRIGTEKTYYDQSDNPVFDVYRWEGLQQREFGFRGELEAQAKGPNDALVFFEKLLTTIPQMALRDPADPNQPAALIHVNVRRSNALFMSGRLIEAQRVLSDVARLVPDIHPADQATRDFLITTLSRASADYASRGAHWLAINTVDQAMMLPGANVEWTLPIIKAVSLAFVGQLEQGANILLNSNYRHRAEQQSFPWADSIINYTQNLRQNGQTSPQLDAIVARLAPPRQQRRP